MSVNRVEFGFFCFINFPILLPGASSSVITPPGYCVIWAVQCAMAVGTSNGFSSIVYSQLQHAGLVLSQKKYPHYGKFYEKTIFFECFSYLADSFRALLLSAQFWEMWGGGVSKLPHTQHICDYSSTVDFHLFCCCPVFSFCPSFLTHRYLPLCSTPSVFSSRFYWWRSLCWPTLLYRKS